MTRVFDLWDEIGALGGTIWVEWQADSLYLWLSYYEYGL